MVRKMPGGKDVLAIAAREIGYREGTNKRNKFGAWFGMDGVAWCMEFVQWVYAQAGIPLPYKTASCGALLNWYRQHDPACIVAEPVEGCVVIFDFPNTKASTDHTGLFVKKTASKITTIDGNTSGGSDSNGGWVQQRTRNLTYANPTYIVPRELAKGEPMEDIMDVSKLTGAQCYEILLKANEYAGSMATPEWMQPELAEAVAAGITDGTRPLATCMRGQAAMMVLRAAKLACSEQVDGKHYYGQPIIQNQKGDAPFEEAIK